MQKIDGVAVGANDVVMGGNAAVVGVDGVVVCGCSNLVGEDDGGCKCK